VLSLCTSYLEDGTVKPMTSEKMNEILAENKAMASQALRVLCAAERRYAVKPEDESPKNLEHDLTYIGLTGMIDPIRPEVKSAIEECRGAGITPIMITGDHKDTAVAIAKELGILTNPSQAVTGADLDDLTDEELDQVIDKYHDAQTIPAFVKGE
jgi:Cation transport ATPase